MHRCLVRIDSLQTMAALTKWLHTIKLASVEEEVQQLRAWTTAGTSWCIDCCVMRLGA
jgi:hypothetical protein